MSYKAPNPISKIKISGEDDCIPSELNEINLSSGSNVSLSTDYATSTITISATGVSSLGGLSDITILNPQNGETLVYDSGTEKWVNSSISTSIAADDILPGDDYVNITTTSGRIDLNSQNSSILIESHIDIDLNSNERLFLQSNELMQLQSSGGSGTIINAIAGDIDLSAFDKVELNTTTGAVDISPHTNFNVLAGGSATISTDDSILLDSDALITLNADSFININSGNTITLDSEVGLWRFEESSISQFEISTSPDSNDISFAATNPYGQVYFGIDTPFPAIGKANTKGIMISLRGYDDDPAIPDGITDGYVGEVGINFQSGGPNNLLDIMASHNDKGFQVSKPNTVADGGTGLRPLVRFAREGGEYGRLVFYGASSTGVTQIGSRPGMHHYFQAEQNPTLGRSNFGIGLTNPNTLFHIKALNPYITIQNSTEENTDGGCEGQIRFSDHNLNTLAYIEGSHDGASDDHKGKLRFLVNDGTNTWRDGIVIGNAGDVKKIGQSAPSNGDVLTWDDPNTRAVWSAPTGGGGGGALALTRATATLNTASAVWADLVGLGTAGAGFSNGVTWDPSISIPDGAIVLEVGLTVSTAFDNIGSYDTIISWLPDTTLIPGSPETHSWSAGENIFGFSGFYDSFGYFSAYYGSKVLGNSGTSTTSGTWENSSGSAVDLKLIFHHESSWGTLTAPSTGSATLFVNYLS